MFDKSVLKPQGEKSPKPDDKTDTTATLGASGPAEGYATRPRGDAATIGPSIRIKGELSGEEDLTIEGLVEGSVNLEKNHLTIGNNGRVHADVRAKTVTILGELRGDVAGNEKVVIRKSGNVRGNIVAPRVSLEEGAMFKGSIEMEPNKAGAAASSTRTDTSTSSAPKPSKPEEPPKGVEARA
jgi:cytoskeletal protein CcmA (bactofilin family)